MSPPQTSSVATPLSPPKSDTSSLTGSLRYAILFLCALPMKCLLVLQVSEEFVLHRETLHLAISYLDRYLSVAESTPKEKMQLVGICALFLAAKMEVNLTCLHIYQYSIFFFPAAFAGDLSPPAPQICPCYCGRPYC